MAALIDRPGGSTAAVTHGLVAGQSTVANPTVEVSSPLSREEK